MQAVPLSPGEKYEFLEPWCSVLRGRLAIEGRFSDHSALGEYWWVSVRPPASLVAVQNREASDIRLLREALELLSLVAIVDNEAWKFLLLQHCGLTLDDDDDSLDGVFAPRFQLRFDSSYLNYSALLPSEICRQFFLPRSPMHHNGAASNRHRTSSGYQEALDLILEFHRAAGGSSESVRRWRRIPYTLQFVEMWGVEQSVLSAHLSAMLVALDDIRKHHEWLTGEREAERQSLVIDEDGNGANGPFMRSEDDGTDDGHYFAYELESVQMCLGTIKISRVLPNVLLTVLGMPRMIFSELLLSLEQDPQRGYFRPNQVHPRDLAAHHRCGMLFNTIFCGKSITTRHNEQPQGVRRCTIETVTIPFFGMDDQAFSGLCSSLAEASKVSKMKLNNTFSSITPTQQTWRWKWLAYALFSDASRSSINEVDLKGVHLNAADVDAIAEVLSTNVPEPGDATNEAESVYVETERAIEFVHVPKDTFIRIKKSIASPDDITSMQTVETCTFRLLQDDGVSEWVNVLVPGRGNGIIARDQILKRFDERGPCIPPQPRRASQGITSLSLSIERHIEDGIAAFPRFLRLIGKSLKRLSILTIGSTTLDVRAILKACPNLDQFFLDSVQIDLDVFTLEVERGNAKIRCFGLAYFSASTETIVRFAKKLGDPHSALAQEMRELCLSADNEEVPMAEESVQAFLNVLNTNHRLMYLDLLVVPALFDKYSAAFQRHHQEPIALEKEKLPLRCRLAFLSVTRGQGRSAIHQLDNDLVKIIFAFAAVCAKRTVCLRCDH